MADPDFTGVLSALDVQAQRLKQASDVVNTLIAAVEKRLIDANIGLEFWASDALDCTDAVGDFGPHDTRTVVAMYLGFAHVDNKWCLAVKAMREVRGFYEGEMGCPYTEVYAAGDPTPLSRATRALRIEAVRRMPDFLQGLTNYVSGAVADIENAVQRLR
jgi:hypothetical protein